MIEHQVRVLHIEYIGREIMYFKLQTNFDFHRTDLLYTLWCRMNKRNVE